MHARWLATAAVYGLGFLLVWAAMTGGFAACVAFAILVAVASFRLPSIWRGDVPTQHGLPDSWLRAQVVAIIGGWLGVLGVAATFIPGSLGRIVTWAFAAAIVVSFVLTTAVITFGHPQSLIPPRLRDRRSDQRGRR